MSFDDTDGDFKKGRFKPAVVLVTLALIGGGAGATYMAVHTNETKLSVDQIAAIKKGIYVLPVAEQLPKWRQLAEVGTFELKQEALFQLFFHRDKETVPLAIKALSDIDHRVRGAAAQVLSTYGLPAAEPARQALIKAFKESDAADKPQVTWALCAIGEKSLRKEVIEVYKSGALSTVERAGGGKAFDTELFATLGEPDDWAAMASDPSDSIRQLVAGILSRTGDKKYLAVLTKLVNDPRNEVARDAAAGLGKIGDPEAVVPLIAALTRADKDDRERFLFALRDSIGGKGLVLATTSVAKEPPQRNKAQLQTVFDLLKALADPRAGDALVEFIEKQKPHHHFATLAALRLAEVGDVRAAPYLAERLKMDPLKVYDDTLYPEMKRNDDERVLSARMLADLAILHPEARAELRAKAEEAVYSWMKDKPQPHANGLRFLVAAESKKYLSDIRSWANPSAGIPKEGATGQFPLEWATAESALRYIGWAKDDVSWSTLEKQLSRKPMDLDNTAVGLEGNPRAMAGMVFRGLMVGAAAGFAQWGDPKAFPAMMKVIEDKSQHESGRDSVCRSLAWVANEANLKEVVAKAKAASAPDIKTQIIRGCLMETLSRRPSPGATADLLSMLSKETELNVRYRVAKALGWGGIDPATEATLFEKLKDDELAISAALALIIGGSPETASRTVALFGDKPKDMLNELKELYYKSFNYFSDEDIATGRLYRWIANAEAIGMTKVADTYQDWAKARLAGQLSTIDMDNGPHSVTRVVMRFKLMEAARKGDEATKKGAITALRFMSEQGVLMALRDDKGDTGTLAKAALFELLNPRPLAERSPAKDGVNVVNVDDVMKKDK